MFMPRCLPLPLALCRFRLLLEALVLAALLGLVVVPGHGQSCTPGGGVQCTVNLDLWLPPAHYQNWDIPMNANSNTIDVFSATVISKTPTGSQSVATPVGFNFNQAYPLVYGTPSTLKFGTAVDTWDSALTRGSAGAFSLDTGTISNGLGTLALASANASVGYKVAGAAASGTILCGNGTVYTSCPISALSGFYYQTMASAGTAQTQRATLNFSSRFVLTDSSSPARTTVDLATTAVTPASYTNGNFTVDAFGRLTAASNGSSPTAVPVYDFSGTARTNVHFVQAIGQVFPGGGTSTFTFVGLSAFTSAATYTCDATYNVGVSPTVPITYTQHDTTVTVVGTPSASYTIVCMGN